MKRIEWPGIATAVGILLIGTIALDLSKRQPLLAALVALGGGTLAYRGAMAKIYADQEKDRREFQRKRLGVFLRTEHACDHLVHRSNIMAEKTSRELREKTVTLAENSQILDARRRARPLVEQFLQRFARLRDGRLQVAENCAPLFFVRGDDHNATGLAARRIR